MNRTIVATLITDTEESLDTIKRGIELELNCAWPYVELISIEERPMPTIDPVVRCKECRWWERDYHPQHHSDERPCNIVGMGTPPEWYCADGERREDE